jgi:peptidoglycan hydrolase-like protein with peptidoglycan-binding domain
MNSRRLLLVPLVVMALFTSVLVGSALAADLGEPVKYDLTFPLEGPHRFSDTFWAGRSHGFHEGQDIMADKMVPVVAVADGVVRLINWTSSQSMNPSRCCTLVLRHDDGWESWYLHMNNDTPGTDDGQGWGIVDGITPGTRVVAGQHIGWVGDSGNAEATASHIHYELRDASGTIVNPYRALVAAGGNDVGTGDRDPLVGGARVLVLGVAGYDVRVLQQTLTSLGYSVGTIDGRFGPMTDAAVKAFQSEFGITPDGRVGRTTKTALAGASFNDPDSDVLSVGSSGQEVRELQDLLREKGYDPAASDGVFGPRTLSAVITFQKDHKLWVDGLVGSATLNALRAAPPADDPGDDGSSGDGSSDDGVSDDGSSDDHTDIVGRLSVGSRGPQVETLQTLLTEQGYDPGPADGVFGSKTRRAVIAFQDDEGLIGDGIVGPVTAGALDGAPPAPDDAPDEPTGSAEILYLGSRGTDVVDLQRRLNDGGYKVGPSDGVFGPLTLAAVIEFQKTEDLSPDGKVGPKTRGALGIL